MRRDVADDPGVGDVEHEDTVAVEARHPEATDGGADCRPQRVEARVDLAEHADAVHLRRRHLRAEAARMSRLLQHGVAADQCQMALADGQVLVVHAAVHDDRVTRRRMPDRALDRMPRPHVPGRSRCCAGKRQQRCDGKCERECRSSHSSPSGARCRGEATPGSAECKGLGCKYVGLCSSSNESCRAVSGALHCGHEAPSARAPNRTQVAAAGEPWLARNGVSAAEHGSQSRSVGRQLPLWVEQRRQVARRDPLRVTGARSFETFRGRLRPDRGSIPRRRPRTGRCVSPPCPLFLGSCSGS